MKAVNKLKVEILTPEHPDYASVAPSYGVSYQHIARWVSDPKRVELLPLEYRIVDPTTNTSKVIRVGR